VGGISRTLLFTLRLFTAPRLAALVLRGFLRFNRPPLPQR